VNYPKNERMLIIRPCVKAICLKVKPAARLLSHLLYLARNCDEQATTFSVSCTQEEIIGGLIEEIDVKTLHKTAIPMLRLLGFLDVDGSTYRYTYTIHLDLIQQCLSLYQDQEQLENLLIVSMQKQLVDWGIQLVRTPIEIVKSRIVSDKLLIVIRQTANSKRGRKPKQEAAAAAISENDRLSRLEENEEGEEARAPEPPVFSSSHLAMGKETDGVGDGDDPDPTEKRRAVRLVPPQPGDQGTGKPAPSSTRAPGEETPTETPTLPARTKEVLPGPEESGNSSSQYKTFGNPESKKSAAPPKLRITQAPTSTPPKQLPLTVKEEPRPPTRAELEREASEFERLLWELAERKMKTRYPTGVRRLNWNKNGVKDILEAGYTLEEIGRAFDKFRPFEIHTFDMPNLYKWLPNLLSGRLTDNGNGHQAPAGSGNIGVSGRRRFTVPPVLREVRS
jgi:hypothetical protein